MVNEEKSEKKFAWQEIIASSAIMTGWQEINLGYKIHLN